MTYFGKDQISPELAKAEALCEKEETELRRHLNKTIERAILHYGDDLKDKEELKEDILDGLVRKIYLEYNIYPVGEPLKGKRLFFAKYDCIIVAIIFIFFVIGVGSTIDLISVLL